MGLASRPQELLRAMRRRWGLQSTTDVHHVIPRSCARHPLLSELPFDVERETCNFVLMPTRNARNEGLRLRPGRLIHEHGHKKYNSYVWDRLSGICDDHSDAYARECALTDLIVYLHVELRSSTPTIPWN